MVQNSRAKQMTICGIIPHTTIPMKQNVAIRIDPMATNPYISTIVSLGKHNRLAIPIYKEQGDKNVPSDEEKGRNIYGTNIFRYTYIGP